MEKGRSPESSTQVQPSRESRKETIGDRYSTCREDIAELAIADIQSCPIIPDFKTPTLSSHPIVVRTQEACFCIDGWHYIEQAKADGRSTVRCYISEINHHSDTELAIRKAAVRVMPQGGTCKYSELVRNACQLYRILHGTSDDLVLFTHGGARRGAGFTDSRDNNIRVVLANRLGKSPTTINKYLQHGDRLDDAAMESLVDAGATKTFFEAIQAKKQIAIAIRQSEQKDPAAIAESISNEVMQWLAEFQKPETPPMLEQVGEQSPQTERSASRERHTLNGNRGLASAPEIHQNDPDGDQDLPANNPTPTDGPTLTAELKRIGEALIEIADSQESPTPQQVETIRRFIQELAVLHQRLAHPSEPEGSGNGGTV
ncbi:hypothetical protein [uncultured Desulfosarcina sp.]|uniref:hypothetical protein n=1 Tax=uncultured Desulfosarcina sp. TaxID=218289 RepID=UPI0029C77F9D|nr:hypothetical protein [uncultured Desulfosarcina sp.]